VYFRENYSYRIYFNILLGLLFLFLFLSSPQSIFAISLPFVDEFESLDNQIWRVNGHEVFISNGWLNLRSDTSTFPMLSLKNLANDTFTGNFKIEFRFKYNEVNHWGNGITLGNLVPNYPTSSLFMYENEAKVAFFQIWQDSSSGKGLRIKYHQSEEQGAIDAEFFKIGTNDTSPHIWTIEKDGDTYSVFLDNDLIFQRDNSRVLTSIMIGNPIEMYNAPLWSEFSLDYIKITTDEINQQFPLILIPGLGASWNTRAMVYGEDVSPESWRMTPFVDIYDRLIETGVNNGYVLGENFFVWNYDWRKNISDISSDLDDYITSTPELSSAEKIDFIGHSLGGLVSRTWLQNHPEKSDRLITVGSPHYGAVQAYEAVAGGKVGNKPSLEEVLMKLFLQIHKRGFQTNAEVIRELAPVLQDLVPTFDFIKRFPDSVIPIEEIHFPNLFLSQLNQEADILSFSHFLIGNIGISTPEWLIVKERTLIDRVLNLWPDGHLLRVIDGIGDGTVLKKSAYLQGGYDPNLEYNLNHRALINNPQSVEKIFNLLGKEDVAITGPESHFLNDLLIFYLASPATLEVNGLTPVDNDLQFVAIPDPSPGDYQVQVTGRETGSYHLFVGQIQLDKNLWTSYQGETLPGEKDHYQFKINPDDPLPDPLIDEDGLKNLDLARSLLKDLIKRNKNSDLLLSLNQLKKIELTIKRRRWLLAIREIKTAMDYLSRFRRRVSEDRIEDYNQAEEIMTFLASSWRNILEKQNLVSGKRAYYHFQKAKNYCFSAEKLIELFPILKKEPKTTQVLSLKTSQELLADIKKEWKDKNYAFVEPNGFLTYLFARETFPR